MKLKLLFALLITQIGFAQQRTCGMEQQMQQIMSDPVAKQEHLERQARFEVELAKIENNQNRANPTATIYIPVAVHFPSVATGASATLKTCLRNLAQSQINILNADYNATNSDISLWPSASSFYPGTNTGSMNVQFVLGTQNHPAGTGIANGTTAVTFGTDFLANANNDSTWAGYMNLVCRNAGTNILGYSPLGGSPSSGATVVITTFAFGSGTGCTGYAPQAPFNLGRTLTHELGHFFNLNHTFAGCSTAANCATAGDRVCDTPATATEWYTCDPDGSVPTSCNASIPQLTMNYMDYVEDACMYMFTAGQSARMLAYYNSIASQFTTTALANNEFLANNFSITPNPNNGTFSINLKETLNQYSVEIYDATGRVIYEKEFNQNQDLQQNITLTNSNSGLYFVTIKSEDAVLTKKILVK